MSDSIDSAVNRSANRAAFVGAAVKYLGKERQCDAEILGDIMVAAVDQIVAAAGVKIQPEGDIPADVGRLLGQLGPQIQQHVEQIAHVAVVAMTKVFTTTLICAARARGEISIDDDLPPAN